jgi:YHS domain-containing protein
MRHLIFLLIFSFATAVFSQTSPTERVKHFNLDNKIAIDGYDPVAYFTVGKAVEGSPKFQFQHQGVTYYFSSKENQQLFEKQPTKYEPQYGGWCAFAMGDYGKKVEINPETFKVVDGKLYLFYNAYFNNTLKSWNKDEKNLKTKADKNWSLLIK